MCLIMIIEIFNVLIRKYFFLSPSELMEIQQNMSFVNEGYASLGETLKSQKEQLSGLLHEVKETQKETEDMMTWLKDMKKTAGSWNSAAAGKDSVKTQLEQQQVKMYFFSSKYLFSLNRGLKTNILY